jgi:hypothetical protein
VNFALPALVILLTLLPGVVFGRGYYSGRFARTLSGISGSSEAALYVLLAIPIDLGALWIAKLWNVAPDWPAVFHSIFGSLPDAAAVRELSVAVERDLTVTAKWYVITLVASYVFGAATRRFVWATRLDTKVHVLRMRNEWFYRFLGKRSRSNATVADVLTTAPEDASRLYRGVVINFQPAEAGGLQLLTLSVVKRGWGRGQDFVWLDVPGDELMLLGPCIHSINLTYVDVPGVSAETTFAAFWRRFWFDEP